MAHAWLHYSLPAKFLFALTKQTCAIVPTNWETFCGQRWLDPIVDIGCSLGWGRRLAPWWSPFVPLCGPGGALQQVSPHTLTLGWVSDSGGPMKSPLATVTGSQVESCKAKQLSHHEDVSFLLRLQLQEQEVDMEMERTSKSWLLLCPESWAIPH